MKQSLQNKPSLWSFRDMRLVIPARAVSFFGVRGVGSVFYLAYAAGESSELGSDWLWSTVGFTIVLSVMLHGVLATPVMKRLDLARGGSEDEVGGGGGRSVSPLAS